MSVTVFRNRMSQSYTRVMSMVELGYLLREGCLPHVGLDYVCPPGQDDLVERVAPASVTFAPTLGARRLVNFSF